MSIAGFDDQRLATDPSYSAWVAANAGSGKTHVLVDRIARLLLSGSAPDRLLCLTFTRAAAAEMSTRLFKRLGTWTLLPDALLTAELETMTGGEVSPALRERARRLFALALESPGGLRIQTIHAFCERLLKRFPLEAGVVPQFSVLDDRATEELLEAAKEKVLRDAASHDAGLADALAAITEYAGEERFDTLMRGIAGERGWVLPFLLPQGAPLERKLWRAVRLEAGASEHSIFEGAIATIDLAEVRRVVAALSKGAASDKARVAAFAGFAAVPDRGGFDAMSEALLTKDGAKKLRLATKGALDFDPSVGDVLDRLANAAMAVRGKLNALFVAKSSANLLRVATAMLEAYREVKSRRAMLDYDDLIGRAVALFTHPGASWILYKLDGGIDHILVDEAQDTSPAQWKIITSIASEFFSGLGAERKGAAVQRTVFAVGDVKQSIMSFQGARPASFIDTRSVIEAQALGARAEFELVGLTRSFRSAPRILELVDEVFADPAANDGVVVDEVATRHEAVRADIAGLVELWPALQPPVITESEAWDAPRDRAGAEHPAVTLAQTIAERIDGWIRDGETVFDKEQKMLRPMGAGDVLVLVRRRNLLAEEIIRQLKRRGVLVAGADRLKLAEHIAVMDLIALGRFVLMPRDDLTLATVLKGPLCGLDEEALFDLAHGRTQSLWSALRARAGEARYASCAAFLDRVWDQADVLQPYEFYSTVLCELGGWRKMLGRLGLDAADPIEEFMNAALDYGRAHTPSLEGFLHAIENSQTEIKRDQDRGEGAVRVMTVHAAKGLEAPVVILPDTCTTPKHGRHDKDLLQAGDAPLWKVESKRDDPVRRAAREAGREDRLREYRRLLYVALTRARDRLYICGYEGKDGPDEGCWYELVSRAMSRLDAHEGAAAEGVSIKRFGEVSASTAQQSDARPAATPDECPAWVTRAAIAEPLLRHMTPSLAMGRSRARATPSDAAVASHALERGRVIHRLLDQLAAAPAESWSTMAFQLASAALPDVAMAQSAASEALRVRRDPALADVFGTGSYGEVALRGLIEWNGETVNLEGRLDRIVIGAREVMIVEFKTDRVVPQRDSAIPPSYVTQLALYRAAVARMFEGRTVNCGILWTAAPLLTVVPSKLLDEAARVLDPLGQGS
ncbi:MAG: double-strand break repair helicase AddA [Alphaproteobacteria bacterium]|nr:double-strand break repair helicase AddA [Alphaproteobacteria bacterium]